MSRKPISIVKNELLNCTESPDGDEHKSNCTSFIGKPDFNSSRYKSNSMWYFKSDEMDGVSEAEAKRWEGSLDSSYLFAYAIGMFGSGFIAERVDLRYLTVNDMLKNPWFTNNISFRYFLSGGMLLSGIFTMLFGFAYYWGIHSIAYFIIIQVSSIEYIFILKLKFLPWITGHWWSLSDNWLARRSHCGGQLVRKRQEGSHHGHLE